MRGIDIQIFFNNVSFELFIFCNYNKVDEQDVDSLIRLISETNEVPNELPLFIRTAI